MVKIKALRMNCGQCRNLFGCEENQRDMYSDTGYTKYKLVTSTVLISGEVTPVI